MVDMGEWEYWFEQLVGKEDHKLRFRWQVQVETPHQRKIRLQNEWQQRQQQECEQQRLEQQEHAVVM
jgi:hypothetical protein